jgi:tellurite resistance protein
MGEVLDVQFHAGSRFPVPETDRWQPPTGQVTYVHPESAYVTSSGPSLALWLDLEIARAAGQQRVLVLRFLQRDRYLLSPLTDWQDLEQALAVTLVFTMPEDGTVQQLYLAVPYAAFPPRGGGRVSLEIAVHEQSGYLDALAHVPIDLPDDIARVPDLLSVTTHTLVALSRAVDGSLSPEEEVEILALMIEHHGLDETGEQAIRRILATAVDTFHTPASLVQALRDRLPADDAERFVEVLYAAARADGDVQPNEQAFIDELLHGLELYDHVKRGPEGLEDCWIELEIPPTMTWEAVRAAYKARIKDYHPDRVTSLAIGFRDYATRRSAAINDAYVRLKGVLRPEESAEIATDDDPTDSSHS